MFVTANRIEGDQIMDDKLAREDGMAFWWGDLDMEWEDIIKMDLTEYGLD